MRFLHLAVMVLLQACAPAVLTLKVRPSRVISPREVQAIAIYRGSGRPDRITWDICQWSSSASVEPTDRTFEAFFPCGVSGLPRVTLFREGRVLAQASTPAPLLVGGQE